MKVKPDTSQDDTPLGKGERAEGGSPWRFCVAPMLGWTDRHCRFLHRLLSRQARLYTEMRVAAAVIHGDRSRLLGFDPAEHPVALQIAGSDPKELARAAQIGAEMGYDEINLNVGCPSPRVQAGRFGACLMAEPDLVADCVAAMQEAVSVPVTVKCRIGIDEQDSEAHFQDFVSRVAQAGCRTFIVHARKAWLSGVSPKQNRDVPPLDYTRVYRLKQARPDLTIVINGGITSLEAAKAHLAHVDGIMMGRAAYHQPWLLAQVDPLLFGRTAPIESRAELVEKLVPYLTRHLAQGGRAGHVTRHLLGLFHGCPGARAWRRHLTEASSRSDADARILLEALALVGPRRQDVSVVS